MGYNMNKFVANVDQNLVCNICACVMQQSVVTLCGHSFCHDCLSTWLARPDTESCPVCRAYTSRYEIIPNIAIRSLIQSLVVWCDHKDSGCKTTVKLEEVEQHCNQCVYRNVECVACKAEVRYCDLSEHCIKCAAITKQVEITAESAENLLTVDALSKKLTLLEVELSQTKKALARSKENTEELENEVRELRDQRSTWSEVAVPTEFDPDYSYGYSPSSVSQLSCLIAKYLLSKPACVDRNRIFLSIKRSFTYYHNYAGYAEDVLMLLATAYASNWFPEHHRWSLERWLEQITHERFPRTLTQVQRASNGSTTNQNNTTAANGTGANEDTIEVGEG